MLLHLRYSKTGYGTLAVYYACRVYGLSRLFPKRTTSRLSFTCCCAESKTGCSIFKVFKCLHLVENGLLYLWDLHAGEFTRRRATIPAGYFIMMMMMMMMTTMIMTMMMTMTMMMMMMMMITTMTMMMMMMTMTMTMTMTMMMMMMTTTTTTSLSWLWLWLCGCGCVVVVVVVVGVVVVVVVLVVVLVVDDHEDDENEDEDDMEHDHREPWSGCKWYIWHVSLPPDAALHTSSGAATRPWKQRTTVDTACGTSSKRNKTIANISVHFSSFCMSVLSTFYKRLTLCIWSDVVLWYRCCPMLLSHISTHLCRGECVAWLAKWQGLGRDCTRRKAVVDVCWFWSFLMYYLILGINEWIHEYILNT